MIQLQTIYVFLHLIVLSLGYTDVYNIDDREGFGRPFDGIGGISGGGATSKLLINYPEPQRSEILDYLFKPNFGASLHILKVEIGGDGQSTDGTEASHMHNALDENYQRGYEWWLMVEAKKRNPNIKIYGLPWSFPGWLNPMGQRNPYQFPVLTATYIIKWIKGAAKFYNVTVDYIGIWNEKDYDKVYVKTLRKELDKAGLGHVKIVAPDAPHIQDWKISEDILKDPELAAAVEYIGSHYPGTITTKEAIQTGKPLWASEDYSTFNDLVGGGCWARILNQNFVNGNITGTISWNLIAAYYDTLPFTRDGLMTAESPWSGHYVVESPIWLGAHTTQFTQIGWKYYRHGYGSGHFVFGGSYVSLASPDGKDLTIIIETMSHDHSKCIRPPLPKYNVKKQTVKFQLKGQFANTKVLQMWKSKLRFDNTSSTFFKKQKPLQIINGTFTLDLDVDVVITLTTLNTGNKGSHKTPPPVKDFPLPYMEGFEKYNEHEEPFNFAQQTGSFEVKDLGGGQGKVMRQMVTQIPVYWCAAEKLNFATNYIGSQKWSDIYVQVDAKLGEANSSDGYFVGARIFEGGCNILDSTGIFFFVFPATQRFLVTGNIGQSVIHKLGPTGKLNVKGWNTLRLLVQGSKAVGLLNGKILFNVTVADYKTHGFAGLGTSSWGIADFDNFVVASPHDGEKIIDNVLRNADDSNVSPEIDVLNL
ncbi:galactocerebrosidase-like isoform X2 [Mercenaria mercenaria]|uniref:galactocerebrosidase-like isoform X2 n=1 Tax=Mercenaria mercenaria TaxID=6596 RepID=UPI00234F1F92|nr:galactocerebrosidase-like isoform X2 [Mercenaria mercenaria]